MSVLRTVCRTCGKAVAADEAKPLPDGFPFCSERCRLIDLGAWAEGRHRIPGAPVTLPESQQDE